jgi:glutamate racemase
VTDAPLGVFDSGIGGLTVARAIFEHLPHESVLYYGDTARVPYGPKSPDTVRRYSGEILTYLLGCGVKAVVVACNTSTAHALSFLRELAAGRLHHLAHEEAECAGLAGANLRHRIRVAVDHRAHAR